MGNVTWHEAKEAANRCLFLINEKMKIYDDPVNDVFKNNLPSVLDMIAVNAYLYGKGRLGKDALIIRNAMCQLEDYGMIRPK